MNEQIRSKAHELLQRYFELGVAEGIEGRDHDTAAGDAQNTLDEIMALLEAAHARYAGSAEAVGTVVTHTVGVLEPYQSVTLNETLPDGTKLYASPAPAVPEVTPEMQAAGMMAWDKAHKEGIREWPEMLERVFIAMLTASQEHKS